MNIITSADVEKFLSLLQVGLRHGKKKDLTIYTSDSVDKKGECYVSLELRYKVPTSIINETFIEKDFDVTEQIKNLLK